LIERAKIYFHDVETGEEFWDVIADAVGKEGVGDCHLYKRKDVSTITTFRV